MPVCRFVDQGNVRESRPMSQTVTPHLRNLSHDLVISVVSSGLLSFVGKRPTGSLLVGY